MTSSETGQTRSRWTSPKLIIGLILAALALIFVFQNTTSASVHFLFLEMRAPGWLWFLGLFLAGVAVGSLIPWVRRQSK